MPYVIIVPAVDPAGDRIPGYAFRCKVRINGHERCVLFKEQQLFMRTALRGA